MMTGSALDYRIRTLSFDEDDHGGVPREAREGVTRLEFREGGLFTDEVYLEDEIGDSFFGAAFHTRTFHSFTNGEYARVSRTPGGFERVLIQRWRGFPKLTFLALGLLGSPASLRQLRLLDDRPAEAGLREVVYASDSGKTLTVLFDPAGTGRLLRAESRAQGDLWSAVRYFEDHVPGVGDLPARPRRMVDARVTPGGRVVEVTIWQAIERDDANRAERELDDLVRKGAQVADLRFDSGQVVERVTERPMRVDELPAWSAGSPPSTGSLPLKPSSASATHAGDDSEATEADSAALAGLDLRYAILFAGLALIGSAFLLRKRSPEAC